MARPLGAVTATAPALVEQPITVQDYWRRPGNLVRRAQRVALSLFAEECAGFDMSRSQLEAMISISQFEGLDQISVARACGIDRSTMGQVLDVMADRGLIRREVHPQDRRKRVLELTDTGEEVFALAVAGARRTEPRLLQPLTDAEVDGLIHGLRTIITSTPSTAPEWTLEESGKSDEARRSQFVYLSKRPGFLLRRCAQVSFALFADATAKLDLTPTQYGMLFLLKVVQTDEATIARLAGVDRSTSDRVLQRLKVRGHVQPGRIRDRPVLTLTASGEALFEDARPRAEAAEAKLLACLSVGEQARMVHALDKILFVHG
ncbi:MAG: MarR family transcriptional regulator [Caulobacteraceae bacterium]